MDKDVRPNYPQETKLYAMIGYCSLLCLVPLLKGKEDPYLLFHRRQGLALFLCEMAVFVVSILFPWLMQPFLFVFGLFSFFGMIKALLGEKFKIPFIFQISERLVL